MLICTAGVIPGVYFVYHHTRDMKFRSSSNSFLDVWCKWNKISFCTSTMFPFMYYVTFMSKYYSFVISIIIIAYLNIADFWLNYHHLHYCFCYSESIIQNFYHLIFFKLVIIEFLYLSSLLLHSQEHY